MIFKIAEVAPAPAETPDEVYLRLIELDQGGMLLRATDKNGRALDNGNILKINAKGRVRLYENVDVPGIETVGEERVVALGPNCVRQPIDRRREGKPLD